MRPPKTALLVRRLMLVVALVALVIAALDLLNIIPGVGAKLTPILLAFIIFFLIDLSFRQYRSYQILRRLSRSQPQQPSKAAPKPNKKRQQNPQPEYRAIAWHGMILRSQSEVKIAKALDNRGLLFLADPKIRLKTESHRQTREVDFLVQYHGKWGILEVDGPHHQNSTEADQWRDARFTEYGLLVVRFPADQCYRQPDQVVDAFLEKLAAHTPASPNSPALQTEL